MFQSPFIGELARKSGSTLACAPDAKRLLTRGELVGVWPEGFKGIGKPYSERYKLQRFGRGGFVAARQGDVGHRLALLQQRERAEQAQTLAPGAEVEAGVALELAG